MMPTSKKTKKKPNTATRKKTNLGEYNGGNPPLTPSPIAPQSPRINPAITINKITNTN